MSEIPTGYQTPKEDWDSSQSPIDTDLNRWEGNSKAIEEGSRTIVPSAPSSNTGTLRNFLNWFANRITAITGKANWWTAPAITLEQANAHTTDYTLQIPYEVTTGTANNYSISTTIVSLTVGMAVAVKINVASTGASTLNWNGKGLKGIKKADGTDMTKLKLNGVYTLRYDGTNFIIQGEGGEYGTAIAAEVLSPKTFGTDTGLVTGTMPDRGTVNITPSTANQAILAGKHSGSGVVYGDPDLVAGNIRSGSNIFNIAGSVIQASGNAGAGDVLSGKTASNSSGGFSGSMPNRGTVNITPGTANQAILSGYHSGAGVVYGDPDLIAANILSGKNIFGVAGNLLARQMSYGATNIASGGSTDSAINVGFAPRMVVCQGEGGYIQSPAGAYYRGDTTFVATSNTGGSGGIVNFTSTGFTFRSAINIHDNVKVHWVAFK